MLYEHTQLKPINITHTQQDATWLERYYTKLHYNAANQTSTSQQQSKQSTFLAIFIGCNKGYDAVNTLRMGSGNPIFDKDKWKDALTNHGTIQLKNDDL